MQVKRASVRHWTKTWHLQSYVIVRLVTDGCHLLGVEASSISKHILIGLTCRLVYYYLDSSIIQTQSAKSRVSRQKIIPIGIPLLVHIYLHY